MKYVYIYKYVYTYVSLFHYDPCFMYYINAIVHQTDSRQIILAYGS